MARLSALCAATVALTAACTPSSPPSPGATVGVVRTALDSMWAGYTRAFLAGDSLRVMAYFTDSAWVIEPGAPTLRGRAAIAHAIAAELTAGRYLDSRLNPDLTELAGAKAIQLLTFHDVYQPAGQAPQDLYGRLGAVLERGDAGTWRISRVIALVDSSATRSASGE
jgi:ketosteroid isomerase-like protein